MGRPNGTFPLGSVFRAWRQFSRRAPDFVTARIMERATSTEAPAEALAAYDGPFPEDSGKAGARMFLSQVPTRPKAPEAPVQQAS